MIRQTITSASAYHETEMAASARALFRTSLKDIKRHDTVLPRQRLDLIAIAPAMALVISASSSSVSPSLMASKAALSSFIRSSSFIFGPGQSR